MAVIEAREMTPFEGFAITNESEVAKCVKNHFGTDSIIPKSMEELPEVMRKIIERNVSKFVAR